MIWTSSATSVLATFSCKCLLIAAIYAASKVKLDALDVAVDSYDIPSAPTLDYFRVSPALCGANWMVWIWKLDSRIGSHTTKPDISLPRDGNGVRE